MSGPGAGYPPPDFDEPRIAGERYEAQVPDTLDLADRAAAAINGIGGAIDTDMDHQMWFWIRYAYKNPFMKHHGADPTCDALLSPTLPMLRTMSGSRERMDQEVGLMRHLLRDTSPDDGLYYNVYRPERHWHSSYGKEGSPLITEDFAVTVANAFLLHAMMLWKGLDGDPAWDKRISTMVDGLISIAEFRGDYAYYPDGGFSEVCGYPRSGWRHTDEPLTDDNNAEGSITSYYGDIIRVLPAWYLESGDERALDLAGRLSRFCMNPRFWGGNPEPVMVAGNELGHFNFHTHNRMLTLASMLEYGRVANDDRVLEFVQRGYEFALTLGIAKLGWITTPFWGSSLEGLNEACTFQDLVRLGIRLTDAGVGDYWDIVDTIVRNHLAEQQLLRRDILERVSEAGAEHRADPISESSGRVIERTLGLFGSCAGPAGIPKPWVMQCCSGNAPQALYYAWEGAVRHDAGTTTINLHLNRASSWVDVSSYLPHQGKVIIDVKDSSRVAVRVASWMPVRQLQTRVNSTARDGVRVGNYLIFDGVKPGDTIELDFPIKESTVSYTANAHRPGSNRSHGRETQYKVTSRGSTVVDISPKDTDPTSYPFYEREHLRTEMTPMKTTTRFVPAKTLLNW